MEILFTRRDIPWNYGPIDKLICCTAKSSVADLFYPKQQESLYKDALFEISKEFGLRFKDKNLVHIEVRSNKSGIIYETKDRLMDFARSLSLEDRKNGIAKRPTSQFEHAEYECRWILHSQSRLENYQKGQFQGEVDLVKVISKHLKQGWWPVHFYPLFHNGTWHAFRFFAKCNNAPLDMGVWRKSKETINSISPINGSFDSELIQWDYAMLDNWDIEKLNKETEKP